MFSSCIASAAATLEKFSHKIFYRVVTIVFYFSITARTAFVYCRVTKKIIGFYQYSTLIQFVSLGVAFCGERYFFYGQFSEAIAKDCQSIIPLIVKSPFVSELKNRYKIYTEKQSRDLQAFIARIKAGK